MSITDDLRKWTRDWGWLDADNADEIEVMLEDFADRIDAEYKAAVDKAHADGERNGLQQARSASEDWRRGFDEGFAAADDWLAEHEDAMAEHGWVKLPVDADGVPIRVGDKMRVDGEPMCSKHRVFAIELHESLGAAIQLAGYGMSSLHPDCVHHYHAPTTEDVLRELCWKFIHTSTGSTEESDVIAEYAKRLQLKEVDE